MPNRPPKTRRSRRTKIVNGNATASRLTRGFTQQHLATRLDINHADVVRVEQGWLPPYPIRRDMARALGVSLRWLFPRWLLVNRSRAS